MVIYMKRESKHQARHYKQNNKIEFSKLIYMINFILITIVMGMSFLCVIMSGFWGISDLSPITAICTSAFAELAIFSIVYARKAQAENVLKISKQIQEEGIETQNIETANQVMNSDFTRTI